MASKKDDPPRRLPLDKAHEYRLWHPNDHDTICVLVVDIDADASVWELPMWELINKHPALMPSWIITKAENGHGQLGWIIERVPTGENARQKPIAYAKAVLYALTRAFSGDPAFTNVRCWNPTWDSWSDGAGDVRWGIVEPRPLGTLYQALCAADLWETAPRSNGRPTPALNLDDVEGRNCFVFHTTRLRARGTVAEVAHETNKALAQPLSLTELNGIIRSIERWEAVHGRPWERKGHSVKAMSDEEREKQRERGRRGGLANTDAQNEARAKGNAASAVVRAAEKAGRAVTAHEYKQHGFSQKEIAQKMNVNVRTVRRWLQQTDG